MDKILTNMEIGGRVREIRKRCGFTQEQLAEKVGVTFQQIQQYENGSSRLNADKLQLIALALRVPIGSIFGDYDERALDEDEIKLLNKFRSQSGEVRAFILNCMLPK